MAKDFDIDLDDVTPTPKNTNVVNAAPVIDLDDAPGATEKIDIDVTEPSLQGVVAIAKNSAQADMPNGRDLINQILGQVQATQAISQFSRTFGVAKLAYVKESKTYKALKGQILNGSELSGTWEEFCAAIGMSVDKADTDIANLRAFGEEALESMTRIGIGYRDLAQYRKLPEDQKTALIEAAKTGDKDQLLDLAETLIEKHVKEKAALNEKLAGLEADLTQAGKRANNMDAEIERLTITNERLANKQRLTSFEPFTEDVRLECMHLQAGVELHLNSLQQLFYRAYENEQTAEQSLRIEQVYISIVTAVARGIDLLEGIHEHYGNHDKIPQRIQAQHVLTPPEAERWLLEYESLKNAHNAAEASRQIQRDKDKPRGRGRPAGSKNKDE